MVAGDHCAGCGAHFDDPNDHFCLTCGRPRGTPPRAVEQTDATWGAPAAEAPDRLPTIAVPPSAPPPQPTEPLPPAPPPPPTPTPTPTQGRRWRAPVVATVVVGVVVALAAATLTVVVLSGTSHQAPAARTTTAPSATTATTFGKGGATGGAAAIAATTINGVLLDDVHARSLVVAATMAVQGCTGDTRTAVGQLQQAVGVRQADLTKLRAMSTTALPDEAALLRDLEAAMTSSDQADQDYAAWMNDVAGGSCPPPTTSDSNFQAAAAASQQATAAKSTFLGRWNPIATDQHLPNYDQSQI